MPATGFSREHFRKNALAYIAAVAAALVLTELLWTATAPRLPEGSRVLFYLAAPWSDAAPLNALSGDLLAAARERFPELQSVSFESLRFPDDLDDYTGQILLMTRLSSGEGDAFLASRSAMSVLCQYGACLPLDDYWAAGWLADSGLTPCYSAPPEGGGRRLTGLELDGLTALKEMGVFMDDGICLAVIDNGQDPAPTLHVIERLVDALK